MKYNIVTFYDFHNIKRYGDVQAFTNDHIIVVSDNRYLTLPLKAVTPYHNDSAPYHDLGLAKWSKYEELDL